MTFTRVCRTCRESFTAKRSKARYCSDACRARAWKERPSATARTRSRRKPSGFQAAHGSVEREMRTLLRDFAPWLGPEGIARTAKERAARTLSDKQRAQLHAREQRSSHGR